MNKNKVSDYDRMPYPNLTHHHTLPDRMAVVATLLGLKPIRADKCRVLELGCARGENLISLAHIYSGSHFVGVDLSELQIREAVELSEVLDVHNVQFHSMNICDITEDFGLFDYIICHGVYSWVPPAVQDRILGICSKNLSPQGIGLISYNTYPGWHIVGMIRSIMRLHERQCHELSPQERVERAREILAFLAEACPHQMTPYKVLLNSHNERLKKHHDSYIFHEFLEEYNDPIYFADFCERLTSSGLRYLGETEFNTMVLSSALAPEIVDRLRSRAPGLLDMEQYTDLLTNRSFRQTLVCHAGIRPNYDVRADRLALFHVASPLRPNSPDPDLASGTPEEFDSIHGMSLTTPEPIVKSAILCLGEEWPRALPFDDLLSLARSRLGRSADYDRTADSHTLAKALLTAYASSGLALVEFWLCPPPWCAGLSSRPVASPLARMQASKLTRVTNLRHETVALTAPMARLLQALDGSLARAELVELLLECVRQGSFSIFRVDGPVANATHSREALEKFVTDSIRTFASQSLLIA